MDSSRAAPVRVTDVAWGPGNHLQFRLNRYPDGATWLNMALDPDARMAEVGGTGESATVTFARLVAWLNGFYAGSPLKRFFDTSAPGTLALPGARSSRIFTLSMVLLVLSRSASASSTPGAKRWMTRGRCVSAVRSIHQPKCEMSGRCIRLPRFRRACKMWSFWSYHRAGWQRR